MMKIRVRKFCFLCRLAWFPKAMSIDIIQGVEREWLEDLGVPRRRDPDALPPRSTFETIMNQMHKGTVAMWEGNTLFAIKAATLTGMILHMLITWSNLSIWLLK